jgi:hypothetical protein
MRKFLFLAIASVMALALAVPAQAQAATGTVTVIHGIPGVTVDVYVNDDLTLPAFAPETITDPLELPAGDYAIDVRLAGAPDTEAPLFSGSATLPAGANATIIANLSEAGTPGLNVFVNDTAATPEGQGRLVVRHTAAAPAVDVLAGGEAVISGLANPDEAVLTLPAGTVSASVAAAGTTDPVIGPADVPVVAGQVTIVYAIGSLQEESLGVLVQTIPVGEDTPAPAPAPAPAPSSNVPVPAGVPSGDSGIAAGSSAGFPVAAGLTLAALALTGLALSARSLAVARRS